jgi:hypothetical protein
MGKNTTRRALHRLAEAGLVSVQHPSGRGLVVTLLDVKTEEAVT